MSQREDGKQEEWVCSKTHRFVQLCMLAICLLAIFQVFQLIILFRDRQNFTTLLVSHLVIAFVTGAVLVWGWVARNRKS